MLINSKEKLYKIGRLDMSNHTIYTELEYIEEDKVVYWQQEVGKAYNHVKGGVVTPAKILWIEEAR
jgi:hypothetical protein